MEKWIYEVLLMGDMFPTTAVADMFPTTYVSNSIATTHVETIAVLSRRK